MSTYSTCMHMLAIIIIACIFYYVHCECVHVYPLLQKTVLHAEALEFLTWFSSLTQGTYNFSKCTSYSNNSGACVDYSDDL